MSSVMRIRESLDYLRERQIYIIVSSESDLFPQFYTNFPIRSSVPKDCRQISFGSFTFSLVAVKNGDTIDWVDQGNNGRLVRLDIKQDFPPLKPRTIMVDDGRLFHDAETNHRLFEENREGFFDYLSKLAHEYW